MSANQNNTVGNDHTKKKIYVKEFQIRDSPLTVRFENSDSVKAIYNLFVIVLVSLITNGAILYFSETGQHFRFGFRLIPLGFNRFHMVILLWCIFNVFAFLCYCSFNFWGRTRILLKPRNSWAARFWDIVWLFIITSYYCSSLYGLQKVVKVLDFGPGSALFIFLEEIKLLMKQYAFVRTNAPLVLGYVTHMGDKTLRLPDFKKFVYFLFVPTYIYRNEYPRTQRIRWKFVFYNFAEVLGVFLFLGLVMEGFLIRYFADICLRKFTLSEIMILVLSNSFPGLLFMLGGFYSTLHSFQNVSAEMFRFGDRMFYGEWWTCRSFTDYFRTWNVVVHDWLLIYLYKDIYQHIVRKNKTVAKLVVFLISGLVHEWILMNAFKLFLPIQFVQFLIGFVLNVFDFPMGNLAFWCFIAIGSGIQVNLYTMEIFARKNCPFEANSTNLQFFIPRIITCDCIG